MNFTEARLGRLLVIVIFAWTGFAFAEEAPFTLSAPVPATTTPGVDPQQDLITELKFKAVTDWLQGYLGSRFVQFQSQVTSEFAEHYILDYKVGKLATDRTQVEITGHLDTDALKRWVRVADTKNKGGGTLRPLFVLSSSLPGNSIVALETASKVRDNVLGRTLYTSFNANIQKLNMKIAVVDSQRIALAKPPRSDAEIKTLRDEVAATNHNGALWVNVAPCKTCGGARMDSYFYNLVQGRLVMAHSDDLALEPKDFGNAEELKKVLKQPLAQFQTDFEELVSSGTLFSSVYHLYVDGIDSYKTYKAMDSELGRLDYVIAAVMKRADRRYAEFEILSQLSSDELHSRFKLSDFARAGIRFGVR